MNGVKYTIKLFDGTLYEAVSENIRQPVSTPPKAREFKFSNTNDRIYFNVNDIYYTPGTTTQGNNDFLNDKNDIVNYFIFLLPDNVSPNLEFKLQGYFKNQKKDPIDIWCICPEYMSAGDVLIVSAKPRQEVNCAQKLTQCQKQLAEAQQQLANADVSKSDTLRAGGHRKKRMTRRNKKKRRMLRKSRRKRQF